MRIVRQRSIFLALLAIGCFAAVIAWKFLNAGDNDVRQVRVLPDGSMLRLERVVYTSGGFNYSYLRGGKLARWIVPILPVSVRKRLNLSGGGIAYGGPGGGSTNLLVLTINRQPAGTSGNWRSYSSVARLQVRDELGNRTDECWTGASFGPPGVAGQLWVVSAFPRRSKTIKIACLATNAGVGWTNAAEFRVPNPAWAEFPQWSAETLPVTKEEGSLAVTLKAFQSGWRMPGPGGLGDAATAARKTRLVFSFAEDGQVCADWVVKRLTISDATGNHWSPSVDAAYQGPAWATNAVIEVFRPLWSGEAAWKVRVELLRVAGFKAEDLWEMPFELPRAGTVSTLTNAWVHDGLAVKLAFVASPNSEIGTPFGWVPKWQAEDADLVYSLGLQFEGAMTNHWLSTLKMTDERGGLAKLMGQRGQSTRQQVVFFKPEVGVRSVRLTMAAPRDRVVEFLTRPEFVDDMPAIQ